MQEHVVRGLSIFEEYVLEETGEECAGIEVGDEVVKVDWVLVRELYRLRGSLNERVVGTQTGGEESALRGENLSVNAVADVIGANIDVDEGGEVAEL